MSDSCLVIDADIILTPFEKFSPGRVVVRGARIESAGIKTDVRKPEDAEHFDAAGLTLVPGFIEPHIHGCAGIDVMDATAESMGIIAKTLARYGTTSFLPTTVSAPVDVLSAAVERLGLSIGNTFSGATPLGIHLEGPFLNIEKRGTHQASNVRTPDPQLLSKWIERSQQSIRLITMAPELDASNATADFARHQDIVVAMGHSDASYAEANAAADAGTRYAVHTFNAMRQFTHRDPGIVGAVLTDDRIFAEIIADGVHVAPEVVHLFAKAKGASRILLATDATSATSMPDGDYALGSGRVTVHQGICRDAEGRLAGSTLTQDRALKNLLKWTDLRLAEALLSLTANTAAALRLSDRGRIEAGAIADLTLLNSKLDVARTWVSGKLVYAGSFT